MCLVSNHAARFIQLQRCVRRGITKAGAACVRVLRAEKQPHGQVQEQVHVQVHANVQGSAQQQQCAMCKSNAVAVSKVLAAICSHAALLMDAVRRSLLTAPARCSEPCSMTQGLPVARGQVQGARAMA
jgi:hypothetical protein